MTTILKVFKKRSLGHFSVLEYRDGELEFQSNIKANPAFCLMTELENRGYLMTKHENGDFSFILRDYS